MGGSGTGWRLAALALAWLGGLAWQLQEPVLHAPPFYAAGALAGAALLLFALWRRRWWWLACTGLALLAFALAGMRAGVRLAEPLPSALEGRDIVVVGIVDSLPQRSPIGLRFRLRVESATLDGADVRLPRRLALGWWGEMPSAHALPRAGERWRLTLRLRRPHGNLNPHGYDHELRLFEDGVRATGTVRDLGTRLDAAAGAPVERLREWVRDAIDTQVADRRAAGVLAALAVGDQAAIEREDWDLYRQTAIAHVMSISGLHVTMFAWLAAAIVGAAWRCSAFAMHRVPAPRAARWGGLLLAAAYALLSGFGVPAQRTLLMLAAVVLLPALGVAWPWPLVLLGAAVLVTVFDPWALLQPGFWLSFAAVGLLMASEPVRGALVAAAPGAWRRLLALLRGGLRTQAVATFGLAPLTLVFFQQLSLVGFAANLVAIPLVTLLVTPLALLGVMLPPLWTLAAGLLQGLTVWLTLLATIPGAVWTAAAAPWWIQAAALLGGALLVLPLPWRLRALGLVFVLPLLAPPVVRPEPGRYELIAADVGQGSAVLVRTQHRLLLVDAGPQYSADSDAGQRVLLPLLRALGERRIDTLLLSHRDSDHVGGAAALLRGLPVGQLLHSLEDGHPLLAAGTPTQRCVAGSGWTWDGVRFDLLHPPAGDEALPRKPNARSCVLRVSAAQGVALLPGDIEREQELQLIDREGDRLRSDVLLVPHHGSRSSSSAEFLAQVQPRIAVAQAGYRNRFGHPAPAVWQRYEALGATRITSAGCGAWRWDGSVTAGVCHRDVARRYWHHAPAPSD